jgi:hypothetical protein
MIENKEKLLENIEEPKPEDNTNIAPEHSEMDDFSDIESDNARSQEVISRSISSHTKN